MDMSYDEFWGTSVTEITVTDSDGKAETVTALTNGALAMIGIADGTYAVLHMPTERTVACGFTDHRKAFTFARWMTMAFRKQLQAIQKPEDARELFSDSDRAAIKIKRDELGGR